MLRLLTLRDSYNKPLWVVDHTSVIFQYFFHISVQFILKYNWVPFYMINRPWYFLPSFRLDYVENICKGLFAWFNFFCISIIPEATLKIKRIFRKNEFVLKFKIELLFVYKEWIFIFVEINSPSRQSCWNVKTIKADEWSFLILFSPVWD